MREPGRLADAPVRNLQSLVLFYFVFHILKVIQGWFQNKWLPRKNMAVYNNINQYMNANVNIKLLLGYEFFFYIIIKFI